MIHHFLHCRHSIVWLAIVVGLFCFPAVASADSPPNITVDIPWAESGAQYSDVTDIEQAFNYARRQEEVQLGLPTGRLGTLNLPTQGQWDAMTESEKALFLINAERTARADMLGDGRVLGLPFAGIETNLGRLAQYYAEAIIASNTTGHSADGQSPFARIDNWPVVGQCHEFLTRAENLAYFWTSGANNPMALERSIYGFLYDDAGSSWGHRETVLLQDKDLDNGNPYYGFKNNVGSAAHEGYLGIGYASSPAFNPYGFPWMNAADVIVMNIIDPGAGGACPNADALLYDFGDGPGYADAWHALTGPILGADRSGELWTIDMPTVPPFADTVTVPMDEPFDDGVTFTTSLQQEAWAGVTVTGSGGLLDGWIDFDGDGVFADPGERIFSATPLSPGSNNLSFQTPWTANVGATWARFRVSSAGGLPPSGPAADGEVEDYQVTIVAGQGPAITPTSSYTVTHRLNTPDPVRPASPISFTIRITNTGDTWITNLPLTDVYSNTFLTYGYGYVGQYAQPASDDTANDGQIDWTDLTAPAPYGFGRDLAPGASFVINVIFTGAGDTHGLPDDRAANTAIVHDALADPDAGPLDALEPLPSEEASDGVRILAPTGLILASLDAETTTDGVQIIWQTANESSILGFNVFRRVSTSIELSRDADGFEMVNDTFIFAQFAGASQGTDYNWKDTAVAPGMTVEYALQVKEPDGRDAIYRVTPVTIRWSRHLPLIQNGG